MLKQPPHDGEPFSKEYVTCQIKFIKLQHSRATHIISITQAFECQLIETYDCIVTLVNIVGIGSEDLRVYLYCC